MRIDLGFSIIYPLTTIAPVNFADRFYPVNMLLRRACPLVTPLEESALYVEPRRDKAASNSDLAGGKEAGQEFRHGALADREAVRDQ